MSTPWGRDGVGKNVSLQERRGHLKSILSSSSCVEDRKIKRQTRNKYRMHVFFKEFLFLHSFLAALYLSSNSMSGRKEGGALLSKKRTDMDRGEWG